MASYVELIRQDVCHHEPYEDASSWPSSVLRLVHSLQNNLKLPRQIEPGPLSCASARALDLLRYIRVSPQEAAQVECLRQGSVEENIDVDLHQRLEDTFNTALVDCAAIRAVVDAEYQTKTPYPKESFLAVFVRNVVLNAHPTLFSLEDVGVALPRHFSGAEIPILKFMTKSIRAPLVISIHEEMPLPGNPELVDRLSHDDGNSKCGADDSSSYSPATVHSPPTMSEFLDACERPTTLEEDEDVGVDAESHLPPQFEAHFFSCPLLAAPPTTCHIPVLCMAYEEQLPVLMSSLLYQRRVWRIVDPMLGVVFSKYATTIRLFVGWLGDNVSCSRALPRVHLMEIQTPVALDLSSPSVTLAVCRLLCGLEQHISGVRDTVKQSVGAVVDRAQSDCPLSWRIDTDCRKEGSVSIQYDDNIRDLIIQWAEDQQYLGSEETMPPRRRADETSVPSSATSTSTASTQPSNPTFTSKAPSTAKTSPIPTLQVQEQDEQGSSIATSLSRFSCSAFAATSEKNEHRIFHWMFDRRVVPQSIPSDLQFRDEYATMTRFIWPETWQSRDDLPPVDAALEPCVKELIDGVAALKAKGNAIQCIPVKEFPFDLRILEQSFSAIFQASRRSREKMEVPTPVYEACLRHDHDRLLFDFFIRLVDPLAQMDEQSIPHLEDPLARPTLETTLRLPKNNLLRSDVRRSLQRSIQGLLFRTATDLESWVCNRGGNESQIIEEGQNAIYVGSQWSHWVQTTSAEAESAAVSRLGMLPLTGRCDALGRLLVDLPNVSSDQLGDLPLVSRAVYKQDTGGGKSEGEAFTKGSNANHQERRQDQSSTNKSGSTLTIPDVSAGATVGTSGARYTMPSSSISSSMPPMDEEQSTVTESVDSLASRAQRLQLSPDHARLELPILTVGYKKKSDNVIKGTNQLRMYLTASVKFLQAIGITNMPVYGVQSDGPIVVLPAAILREDGFVYMFERLVEKLDISTPVGAWHYATILCRLAHNHAKVLEKKFEDVKDDLISSLTVEGWRLEGWATNEQMARLKAENKVKLPPVRKSKR